MWLSRDLSKCMLNFRIKIGVNAWNAYFKAVLLMMQILLIKFQNY